MTGLNWISSIDLALTQSAPKSCRRLQGLLFQHVLAAEKTNGIREISYNRNAVRAVTLRWQLAEVFEKQGDLTKASLVLEEAADAAKGTAMASVARKRLEMLGKAAK